MTAGQSDQLGNVSRRFFFSRHRGIDKMGDFCEGLSCYEGLPRAVSHDEASPRLLLSRELPRRPVRNGAIPSFIFPPPHTLFLSPHSLNSFPIPLSQSSSAFSIPCLSSLPLLSPTFPCSLNSFLPFSITSLSPFSQPFPSPSPPHPLLSTLLLSISTHTFPLSPSPIP